MPQFVTTPWRFESELAEVRGQFYPQTDREEPDMRRRACDKVAVWQLRGGLPHAVESTASLVDAVLHDRPETVSTQSIRGAYAMAFSRFVTGLTDIDQNAKRKKNMFGVGRAIGLPASFVNLRHQIIHEQLPTLGALREAVSDALKWLYNDYWVYIPQDMTGENRPDFGATEVLDEVAPVEISDPGTEAVRKLWVPKPIGKT